MNLVDANYDRAILIASLVVPRLRHAGVLGAWQGWTQGLGLVGKLVTDTRIEYRRSTGSTAVIIFENPQLIDIKEISWSDPVIFKSRNPQSHSIIIKNPTDASYEEEVSHTFEKTRSVEEGITVGAEIALTTYIKGSYAAIEAGAEIAAKLYSEYTRQWGEATTESDTITSKLTVPPNTNVSYIATRSVDKIRKTFTAKGDFEYAVTFADTALHQGNPRVKKSWDSWYEFKSVATGHAAADKAMWGEFQSFPVPNVERRKMETSSNTPITFPVEYDSVQNNTVTITPVSGSDGSSEDETSDAGAATAGSPGN